MPLSILQERLERSLFEAIRKALVYYGYTPDITNNVRYPAVGGAFNATAKNNWNSDIDTVVANKGFAVEVFGHASSDARATKQIPRITIESGRSLMSELGAPMDGIVLDHPTDDTLVQRQALPYRASTFYFDIHLISNKAAQDRVLNAVLAKALGNIKFIPYYDDPNDTFMVEQFNFFEVPDTKEGIEEKVYSYQVPDVYDVVDDPTDVTKIKEITIDFSLIYPNSTINDNTLEVTGVEVKDGAIKVDENGEHYL